jgi:hypothetical protein
MTKIFRDFFVSVTKKRSVEYIKVVKVKQKRHPENQNALKILLIIVYFQPPPNALYRFTTDCSFCNRSLMPLNCAVNKLCSEVKTSV